MPPPGMGIHEQTSAAIQRRLEEYLAGTDPASGELRSLALRLQALPLYADPSGAFALRPDGELVFVPGTQDLAAPTEWTTEVEPRWRAVALVAGCERYPELASLLLTSGRLREQTER